VSEVTSRRARAIWYQVPRAWRAALLEAVKPVGAAGVAVWVVLAARARASSAQ
jgi:hypothetical protein